MDFFEVEVSELKAANMNSGNLLSYSPYVRVFVGDTNVGRTDIMVRTEHPEWSDKLTFTVPQISNTFVLFKVYDAVILGDDTLLGFVEVPIRLDNSVKTELADISPLRDGVGILEYKIKCTQMPLASLSPLNYGNDGVVEKISQLGLFRSLLPRRIRSIFLREFENCAYSKLYSNFFAIDAARDFEDLFTVTGGHTLSSHQNCQLEGDDTESPGLNSEDTSPFVIDGRIEGSVVAVVLPAPVVLRLADESNKERTAEECLNKTVTVIRIRPHYGKIMEKMVSVDTNRGSLNMPWNDLISTDRLASDGITVDIVAKTLHQPEKKKNPTAGRGTTSTKEEPEDSIEDANPDKLICRSHFSYLELIESGKGSTGVNGEMIVDNKLKLRPSRSRMFDVSLSGGSTAAGTEKWGLLSVKICNSMEDMRKTMTEKYSTSACKSTRSKPFEWIADPLFKLKPTTHSEQVSPDEKPSRAMYPSLKRPPRLSEALADNTGVMSGLNDIEAATLCHPPLPISSANTTAGALQPTEDPSADPPRRTGPHLLPPYPQGSFSSNPPPSNEDKVLWLPAGRTSPPPPPPNECAEPTVAGRRPSFKPNPPPESPVQHTSRLPFFSPVPPPSDGPSSLSTEVLPVSTSVPPTEEGISTERKGPPPLPLAEPRSMPVTPCDERKDELTSWRDEYDRNAALFTTVALNSSPGSPELAPFAVKNARKTEEELRIFWASSSEDSNSETEDIFADWTEVFYDDFMDSSSESSAGDVRVKHMTAAEADSEACKGEYLVIEMKRNEGNLLVGFQQNNPVVEPDVRTSLAGPNSGKDRLRSLTSRSRHIRIVVPLPSRMLSSQCLDNDARGAMTVNVVLPRPPGSSYVDDCVLSISCRTATPMTSNDGSNSIPSYGVHMRWTVANPSCIGFARDNTYKLPGAHSRAKFRESPMGVNAYSMNYRCCELRATDAADVEETVKDLLVDLSPAGMCVYARDCEIRQDMILHSSPRKVGAKLDSSTLFGDVESSEVSPVPTKLSARLFEKKNSPKTSMVVRSAEDDDEYEDDGEEEDAEGLGVDVDMTPFLRSDESPFGFTISLDVYENQFMMIPKAGAKQRGVALRGQRWMPLGARSSLSSRSSVSVGPFTFTPKEAPLYHTFSDISGVTEFPAYASLVPAANSDGLLAKSHSISEDIIVMDGFEVSGEWTLVKAFGSQITGYESRIDVQHHQQEDDYDDLGDDDGECWWYAATLDNLLTNTACYQSYYPGCLYRRRCWRKYLRHKVSSLLRFEDLHRKMKPYQLQTVLPRASLANTIHDPQESFSPRVVDNSHWEWNWADVTDVQPLSPSLVTVTVKTELTDSCGTFRSRQFVIGPCCAKRIVDIVQLRRGLAEARDMIEKTVIPAIRSGRNLFHCNRIDSCGYISIISDVRQDVIDQRAILDTMEKLREIIQDATVAMIPELHKRCHPSEVDTRENVLNCDLVTYSSAATMENMMAGKGPQPVPLAVSYPDIIDCERETPNVSLVFLLLERLVGYYRLISGYTKQGSAISKSPLSLSLSPALLASVKQSYSPNTNFMKNRAPSVIFEDLERDAHNMWKLKDDDVQIDEIINDLAYFRPEYTVKDTLTYVGEMMSHAVDGILCTQKAAVSSGDADIAALRYIDTLCQYANNCVCKIVSVIRAIIAWNSIDDISGKSGPWADGFLPLTNFVVKNNPRLMLTLLAVTTTAPFGVKKVPCFSRYTGIRTLIHWELQPRARSLFLWVKSLRNGGLKYILETRCFYYGEKIKAMFSGKESTTAENEKDPFTTVPDGFHHTLRECLLNGYLEVDYSDVVPVKGKALEQTDQENYSSLLMEDKGFSVTAMARLHNLLTHTAVQCFSMLLNEYMLLLLELRGREKSVERPTTTLRKPGFVLHPLIHVPKLARRLTVASRSALYMGTDSSRELIDPDFCMMSAVAADCKQLQTYVEEFSTVSFPFFFDHLVRSIEKKESAPIRKLLVDIHNIHRQLGRLQADFGRLHARALREQSRFIFRYCRPFELSVIKISTDGQKPSRNLLKRFPSLAPDFDPHFNVEALPIIDGYDAGEVADAYAADEVDAGVDVMNTDAEHDAPAFSPDDFPSKLGYLCRLIFLISGKESYDIFVEHGLRAIMTPILNAIRQVREHVELCDGSGAIVSIDTHKLHKELRGELLEIYRQISNLLIPAWKPPRTSAEAIPENIVEAPVINTLFADSEGESATLSSSRYVRTKFKSLSRNLFAVLCAVETVLKNRKKGEDALFFEALSSVDEFQTPLLNKDDDDAANTEVDELDSSTMGKYNERNRAVVDGLSKKSTSSHYSEAIKISMLSVRGIPCVTRRSSNVGALDECDGTDAHSDKRENAIASEAENIAPLDLNQSSHRVGSCFLVIKCYSRSGILKNTFQTKGASEGDRNPTWSDNFVSDPQRCSDLLPGGPDPVELLEVELYDRIMLTPPTLFYSGTYEALLMGKVSIPLEFVRLQSIKHWFVVEPSDMIVPTEYWRVALFIHVQLFTAATGS